MSETPASTEALLSERFDAPAWRARRLEISDEGLCAGRLQVMQTWEQPLMRRLAQFATRNGGRVLEVGFGLGISANEIMNFGCAEYVLVEAHPDVAERARQWAKNQSVPVTIVEEFWQNCLDSIGTFDGILFDTYPVNNIPGSNNYFRFLPQAHRLLRPGGGITYFSGDTREIRPEHISLLFSLFDDVEFAVVEGLQPPGDCRYWRHDHMIAPYVRSPRQHAATTTAASQPS